MKLLSSKAWLQIDVANTFGLDKLDWDDRLIWFYMNEANLESREAEAETPHLYAKAVRAWREVEQTGESSHVMGLDATSSGIQLYAVLTGCEATGRTCNVVNIGRRADVYQDMAKEMSLLAGREITRKEVKRPIMTFFYGSTAQPESVFGKGSKLLADFYQAMHNQMPGAMKLMNLLQSLWDPKATEYCWVMPDGHEVRIPVTVTEQKRLECDEFHHIRYEYRMEVIQAQEKGRSLAANAIHSVDAFVCREMIRKAHAQGFEVLPIHDCFMCSPRHVNKLRQNYIDIMADIAANDYLSPILSSIAKRPVVFDKPDISELVKQSEYMLS